MFNPKPDSGLIRSVGGRKAGNYTLVSVVVKLINELIFISIVSKLGAIKCHGRNEPHDERGVSSEIKHLAILHLKCKNTNYVHSEPVP